MRLVLNQLAESRDGQGPDGEPDDDEDYPDDDAEDNGGGPIAISVWPGFFTNDVG